MNTLQQIIDQALKSHPHWCKLKKQGGPDPQMININKYSHFIRFPSDHGYNTWCFETKEAKEKFMKDFKAIAYTR